MSKWLMHFDGSCEPRNPGGRMNYGWTLEAGDHPAIGYGDVPPDPENTNNVAEYAALYFGLCEAVGRRTAAGTDYPGIVVRGDSKLVVEQMAGRYGCHKPRLQDALAKCRALAAQLEPFAIEWVPREQNDRADALTRKAYLDATGKPMPERVKVPK